MSEESTAFGAIHYEVMLKDLRAKRDQINQAIQALEALLGPGGALLPSGEPGGHAAPNTGPGAFLSMTIPDATKKLLKQQKRTMGNAEIAKALQDGGLAMQSAEPANTVGSVLTRRFQEKGDIVKVGRGTWGLAEWYPNRSFKKKNGTKGDTEEAAEASPGEPTATE